MKRLAEEKIIRAEEKAKRKARQQAKKARELRAHDPTAKSQVTGSDTTKRQVLTRRHNWKSVPYFSVFDSHRSDWVQVMIEDRSTDFTLEKSLHVVSWNVLFDINKNSEGEFEIRDTSLLNSTDTTYSRWQRLIQILEGEDADIIALQEVTPRLLRQLEAQDWVQRSYHMSSSVQHASALIPYGNLFLWKTSVGLPRAMHICLDGERNRATLLSLQRSPTCFLNIANIHLPADKQDHINIKTVDRSLARRREMNAVIAKLQILEKQQLLSGFKSVPIILGDCNVGVETSDIVPKAFFQDLWLVSDKKEEPGFTFDWKKNPRANKTRSFGHSEKPPRRIDRIFLGRCDNAVDSRARLIGDTASDILPPSDHFGVSISLSTIPDSVCLCSSTSLGQNAFSSSATPTSQTLLAVIMERNGLEVDGLPQLFDPASTLPLAHITLLNGFVDVSSDEARSLAIQAVEDSIRASGCSGSETTIPLCADSFSVFEHTNSSTLVYKVDLNSPSCSWLGRLYETLRACFVNCHEQESRFATGWNPHLSMGSFAHTAEARRKLAEIQETILDHKINETSLHAFGVGIFQRDPMDGKLYLLKALPFASHLVAGVDRADMVKFSRKGGEGYARVSAGANRAVLNELERACRFVMLEMVTDTTQVDAQLVLYGSSALGVSLVGLSDLDATLVLRSNSPSGDATIRSLTATEYFRKLVARLNYLHPTAKTRVRVASKGSGVALYILTVRLFGAAFPPADILLCRMDHHGQVLDKSSQVAWDAVADTRWISRTLQLDSSDDADRAGAVRGALRIIKKWAHDRKIYGQSHGFLGGGGWAVLFAYVLEEIPILDTPWDAEMVASHFFHHCADTLANKFVISIDRGNLNCSVIEEATDLAQSRGTYAVLSPTCGGSFTRSSTPSTVRTTQEELWAAKRGLRSGKTLGESLKYGFVGNASSVLCLVTRNATAKPVEVKAWLARTSLSALVGLERALGSSGLRPYAGVTKITERDKSTIFTCRIGLEKTLPRSDITTFVEKFLFEHPPEPGYGKFEMNILGETPT